MGAVRGSDFAAIRVFPGAGPWGALWHDESTLLAHDPGSPKGAMVKILERNERPRFSMMDVEDEHNHLLPL